jgi:hypothetical protein
MALLEAPARWLATCYDAPLPDLLYFVAILGPGGQEMDNADPPICLGNSPAPLV